MSCIYQQEKVMYSSDGVNKNSITLRVQSLVSPAEDDYNLSLCMCFPRAAEWERWIQRCEITMASSSATLQKVLPGESKVHLDLRAA